MQYRDLILKLQKSLNENGETLKLDGDFGPNTLKALSKFEVDFILKRKETKENLFSGSHHSEGTLEFYLEAWDACEVVRGEELKLRRAIDLIENGFWRYLDVANHFTRFNTDLVAYILGAIHYREASCDFRGVLHNGEKIVGTSKVTSLVPKGRGPFATWSESAIDAIKLNPKRWEKVLSGSAKITYILKALESFNGLGYINGAGREETSPYLWACSNINDGKGLYTSDGKFDAEKSSRGTVGAGLILKELWRLGKIEVDLDCA